MVCVWTVMNHECRHFLNFVKLITEFLPRIFSLEALFGHPSVIAPSMPTLDTTTLFPPDLSISFISEKSRQSVHMNIFFTALLGIKIQPWLITSQHLWCTCLISYELQNQTNRSYGLRRFHNSFLFLLFRFLFVLHFRTTIIYWTRNGWNWKRSWSTVTKECYNEYKELLKGTKMIQKFQKKRLWFFYPTYDFFD